MEELGLDGVEIAMISEPNTIRTEPNDGGSNGQASNIALLDDLGFTVYKPPPHVCSLDLVAKDGLEFPKTLIEDQGM